ncbi:TAP-like domain-containing protein [Trichoderma ceciliae]
MPLHLLVQAAAFAFALTASTASASSDPVAEYDWASIVPSRDLEYHDCYNGFKCARLSVPLDWRNASDDRTVAIAMVKLPAVVPDDDATFGGSIFLNPGGPGGSGVSYAVNRASTVQKILVDKPGIRHYEIVSFDPRGIGRTTPATDCFRSNDFVRTAWTLENHAKGPLSSGPGAISYGLGIVRSFSIRCEQEEKKWGEAEGAMQFVNTPSVARDMVEMVDKIDQRRKREAAKKKQQQQHQKPQRQPQPEGGDEKKEEEEEEDGGGDEKTQLELKRRGKEDQNDPIPRLQYIGFSYGTVLGNYFASMFPGRVGRIVLDGVMDAMDYSTGSGWLSNIADTDKMFDEFWEGCYGAGPNLCPFLKSDANAKAAQKRFWSWAEHLDEYPVAMYTANGGLMALRGEDIRRLIGNALYNPLQQFQPLAVALYEGMAGNLSQISSWVDVGIPKIGDACQSEKNVSTMPDLKEEAAMAVLCGDGMDITGRSVDWWQDYVVRQQRKSRLFGSYWSTIRFSCSGWQFRPNWVYRGPFSTPKPSRELYIDRPAAPLLFLSSRLDPVTPLRSARVMADNHPGSAVVVQDTLGHCTWGSGPSRCTWKIVADYFHHGTVPDKETRCEEDCGPWDKDCDAYKVLKRDDVDESSWRAMFHLDEPIRQRRFPLGVE